MPQPELRTTDAGRSDRLQVDTDYGYQTESFRGQCIILAETEPWAKGESVLSMPFP